MLLGRDRMIHPRFDYRRWREILIEKSRGEKPQDEKPPVLAAIIV